MAIVKISVLDQNMKAVENVNVALVNSFDGVIVGAKTDASGVAVLVTTNKFFIGLKISHVGFETERPDISKGFPSYVQLTESAETLDGITIKNDSKDKKTNWMIWLALAIGAGAMFMKAQKSSSKSGLKTVSKPRKVTI